jgi:hypothetical protein
MPDHDYRALCAELADALAEWQLGGGPPEDIADADLINRARAALAQPEPVAPTDEELEQLVFDNYRIAISFACDSKEEAQVMISSYVKFARAVLARYGTPTNTTGGTH